MARIVTDGRRRRARVAWLASRPWRTTSVLVAMTAAASVGTAAGCSAAPEPVVFPNPPSDTGSVPRSAAAPATTWDSAEAAVVAEVLGVYRDSVAASVAANQAGDPHHPPLYRYLAGAALAWVERHTREAAEDGVYYAGDLRVVSATVTDLDLAGEPPSAMVEACLDGTDYRPVHRDTGAPVAGVPEGGRFMERITVRRFADGRWLVAEYHPVDRPC